MLASYTFYTLKETELNQMQDLLKKLANSLASNVTSLLCLLAAQLIQAVGISFKESIHQRYLFSLPQANYYNCYCYWYENYSSLLTFK